MAKYKKRIVITKICANPECNCEFKTKRKTQKYCSTECIYNKSRNERISKIKLNQDQNKKDEITKRRQDTLLKKYGVVHNSQIEHVKNAKYGKCGLSTDTGRKSYKKSMIEKYGVTNPSHSDKILMKKWSSFLEKYGQRYPYQVDEFYKKMRG